MLVSLTPSGAFSRHVGRVGDRLSDLAARLAERLLVAALVTSLGIIPAVARGWAGGCVLHVGLFAVACAAVASLGISPRAGMRRQHVRVAEGGFTIFEVLVTTAVVSILIFGVAYVYGSQRGSTAREVNADSLRDVTSAIDVDASAISAYDPNARAAFESLATQTTTLTVNGNSTKVKLGGVASGALSVIVSSVDGSQASVVAPLPIPKAVPQ